MSADPPALGSWLRARATVPEQQIFHATERLLETVTARELSVAQILREASVSRATFYHYFPSKWEVILGLADAAMDGILERTGVFTGADGDLPRDEALWRSIDAGARQIAEHRAVFRAIVEHWGEVPELRERWLEIIDRFTAATAEQIDRDRATGAAPPGPPSLTLASTLMWSTINVLYIAGLGQTAALPSEDAVTESVFRLWHGSIFGAVSDSVPPRRRFRQA